MLDHSAEWVGDESTFRGWRNDELINQLSDVESDLKLMESRPDWEPGVGWARCLRNQKYWLLLELTRRREETHA